MRESLQTTDETAAPAFSERLVWRGLGDGWRHLHGSVQGAGASFEWHDFVPRTEFDWSRSFHPGSIEICLNLEGLGQVGMGQTEVEFLPLSVGFYRRGDKPLRATRAAGQRHQFLTVEISYEFLRQQFASYAPTLHPLVRDVVTGTAPQSAVAEVSRMTSRQQQLLASLRDAPVLAAAQTLWYQAKVLEVAAELFFVAPEELFCQRQQRLAGERVTRVIALLEQHLAEPLTLEEIGRAVGCSPFHLSRTFSASTGLTIPQYLRQLRLEKSAELLRSGKFNVTQAAMEVGYSSLSHFSQAFHETFGCCPGLYPLKLPAQKAAQKS